MAQNPIAGRDASPEPRGGTLAEAWNASFVGRYVKSHHISRTALAGAALGVAILFFVLGAALRLLVGPISLGPLSGQISDALAEALPGITVKYDQAAVQWSRDQGRVNLVVLGARVFDSSGRIVAQAPEADIDLAAQPFVQGKIVVTRITLVGVQLTLVRNSDGSLRLGVEHDQSQRDIISRITDAINKNSSSASSLESFAVRDARVAFLDETTGLFLVAPRADVRIATSGRNLVATLKADVEVSGQPAHISGDLELPPQAGPVNGHLAVQGLDIAALGRNAKMFSFLRTIAMVADFSSGFSIEGTHLLHADFAVGASGTAQIVGIDRVVRVSKMHLAGRYDRSAARIAIDDASLDSDQMRAHVVGQLNLIADSSGAISRLGVALTADKTELAMAGTFVQPVFLPLVTLKGSYLPATHDILIDQLSTSGGALVLDTSGKITLVEHRSPVLELKGHVATLSIRDMLHYWPLGMGEGAREWIGANIYSGSLGPLQFETHLPAGALDQPTVPDGALLMTFPVLNVEASYVTGLTHLTGLFGTAKLTGTTFGADISRARIGPLLVSRGHAIIPDLNAPSSPGDISAHVDGSMTDLLRLTDLQPLNYATRFGIDPAATTGNAAIDLGFHVPMRRNLSVDDIGINIRAVVSGFGISLGKKLRLSDGQITFDIDNTHLHAYGAAGLSTSRLNIDWVEVFRTANPVTTTIGVKGQLDQAGREALGVDIGDFLKGPIGLSAKLTGHRGQLSDADMDIDLTPATLSYDLLGISKPVGVAAAAHATAKFGPHSAIQSENMTITGAGIQATGTLGFNEQGSLVSLSAPQVRAGATNDFALDLKRSGQGLDIDVRGRSLDGTQLARRGSDTGKGSSTSSTFDEPFHISAHLDRLVLRNGVAIAPFALDVTGIGERPATLTLTGRFAKSGTLSGSMAAAGNDRRLVLATNDAGTLVRGLFGFASMKGGKLDLKATLHGPATTPPAGDPAINDYEGVATLKDFRILNQPFLARLFSSGSLLGFVNLLQGSGIEVDELKVPFSASNGVLGLHNARASGPAIGISAEGYIDRPKNEIEIKGTLVPLFGINSVLGIIPLLGDILVSKPGEGIIGMTYTVRGDADEPTLTVNPLSMITPGIFRRIFEGKMPNAANAPSNAQPAPVVVTPQNPDVPPDAANPDSAPH